MDPAALPRKLGEAIRAKRQGLELSQEEFADHISMHRAYYSAIERGERNMTLSTLSRVCNGLGIKPSRLLSDADL
jgi:transcriptional regulator with XRE-family HTH domain